jgi:transcriptional antiterminator RfaH
MTRRPSSRRWLTSSKVELLALAALAVPFGRTGAVQASRHRACAALQPQAALAVPFWAVAQLEANRERLALHCLQLAGYTTYAPRIAVAKPTPRRSTVLLFPGYVFIEIVSGWWSTRWSAGVARLVLAGDAPARVPDQVISELRSRERGGLITLPTKLPPGAPFAPGDRLRVRSGPFTGLNGLYAGQAPRDRVLVLLQMLGGLQRVEMLRHAVEPA